MKTEFLVAKTNYFTNRYDYHIYLDIRLELKTCKDWVNLQEKEMFSLGVSGWVGHYRSIAAGACESGGQIQDDLNEWYWDKKLKLINISKNDFQFILWVWKKYHLNDLQPGTINQYNLLKKYSMLEKEYDEQVTFLKEKDLFEDMGYKYGHGWLCQEIPKKVLNRIINIMFAQEKNTDRYIKNLKELRQYQIRGLL